MVRSPCWPAFRSVQQALETKREATHLRLSKLSLDNHGREFRTAPDQIPFLPARPAVKSDDLSLATADHRLEPC